MVWARVIALAAFIALYGPPVGALELGAQTGPVLMNPGGTICDTAEDAVAAIGMLDGEPIAYPASCGRLMVSLPAIMEVVGHRKTRRATYAILKVLFLPPSTLGVQFGWIRDRKEAEGVGI